MATKDLVTKVWIEEGCIVCDACETAAPDVFHVTDDTCVIRPEAMDAEFNKPRTDGIVEAAEECPTDVIKFETVAAEVSGDATDAAAEPAAVGAAAAPAAAPTSAAAAPAATGAAEVRAADAGKAPERPATTPTAEPATAAAARAPVMPARASVAGDPDPAIHALLKAATTRGGNASIQRQTGPMPEAVEAWQAVPARELPPDARHAKVVEAARAARGAPDQQRRAFVNTAALTVGWVTFGVGTGVSIGPAFGRFLMPNVLEEPDPRVRVGKRALYAEMQPGDVNEDYKPQGIWMIREEDRIAALSIICTHLGCIPNWLPNDRKFKCPCHGSGYKPNGINFEGPTPRPLERFKITVEDGIVVVDKSKKYQYELGQWDMPGSFLLV
ncbi:MAG: Rieske 2Fe-2S domain-containing protein [Phycisphaerae bacterium]